jgi:hypothetical protein
VTAVRRRQLGLVAAAEGAPAVEHLEGEHTKAEHVAARVGGEPEVPPAQRSQACRRRRRYTALGGDYSGAIREGRRVLELREPLLDGGQVGKLLRPRWSIRRSPWR